MSRAGKFIPGGSGSKDPAGRTGPIRAPVPGAGPEATGGKKTPPAKAGSLSLIKPVSKNQRLPIVIMSAVVCCLLVSFAWYEFAVVPVNRQRDAETQRAADIQRQLDATIEAQKKHDAEVTALASKARATLIVDSRPTGATVTIGDEHKPTPAAFNDLVVGALTVVIHADGYDDYKQDVTVTAETPTDLGTINLVQKAGSISLSSPQSDVTYQVTGPGDYSHSGQVPDKLDKLVVGDYQVTVQQHDWKLPTMTITVHDKENVVKEIKFPYASVSVSSTPPGATVREGHIVLGKTPVALSQLRPGDLKLSVDLPPYTTQRFTLSVPESGNVSKQINLKQDRDFIAASGMVMVWIPEGGFWAGKYQVLQNEYETVAGTNPSTFRGPNRPVETISWDTANAFCDKLNQYERKAGKLPANFHYSLPTESQWSTFSADADIDQSAMSRGGVSLSSTKDAGASEPNKYGLYDTLGNVWEWCLDAFDEKGNHSLRGGSWLSSPENFPSTDTRSAGPPKYADKFTGFRVVLIPGN